VIADCAAAIIAGGRGTRLGGTNKALVEIDGRPILARQLDVLRRLFAEILIVANDPAPFASFGLPVVCDRIAGKGAPGGVHAALEAARAPWVFCLACDMPFIRVEAVALLAQRRAGVDSVAPVRNGRPEPLFAFYSKRCAAPFGALLRAGDPSLAQLMAAVRATFVSQEEIEKVDPGSRSLENVNTKEDLARIAGTRGTL
jgi:molybdopterin-guanine dinucleotide biosynthesis protein A